MRSRTFARGKGGSVHGTEPCNNAPVSRWLTFQSAGGLGYKRTVYKLAIRRTPNLQLAA
jgi:hypothetical protein